MKPSDYAKQYASRFPEMRARTLARKMYNENEGVFSSESAAYDSIRYVRGREIAGFKTPDPIKHIKPEERYGKYGLRKGRQQGKEIIKIKGPAKVLIISDMHVPFHDERAIDLALEDGVKHGCDTIYLNGDQLDFYQVSDFMKDPKERPPEEERDILWEYMDVMERLFKKRYLKKGNHEVRWDRALFTQAKIFSGFKEFHLENILDLDKRGWHFVDSVQRCMMGDSLNAFHGHEVGRGAFTPVYPARALFMKIKDNGFAGHYHQSSQYTDTRPLADDAHRTISTWMVGCTCKLVMDYATVNNWNHGHALIDLHADGSFEFNNRRHINGRVFPV